jgi:O-acetylhomoserine (thiol)-lyase
VIHPASTTHFRMDAAALAAAGIAEGTIRLSIGLEDPDDLIDDLKRALKAAQKSAGAAATRSGAVKASNAASAAAKTSLPGQSGAAAQSRPEST